MRRSGRTTQGWRDRPVPRNCPRWLRGSTRTETDREEPLIEMDSENFRPPQKTEGQPATGTRDRVPMLEDPCHDRREGAPLRPVKAKRDYTKCTQRPDGVYISKRTSPPPEDRWRSRADAPNRKHHPRTVRQQPPRPAPPRFQGRMYLKRERTVSGNEFVTRCPNRESIRRRL